MSRHKHKEKTHIFRSPILSPAHCNLLDPIIPAMSIPPPPVDPFSRPFDDDTDFGAAFGFCDDMDFGATFGFGADFGLRFDYFDCSSDDSYPADDILSLSHSDIDSSGGMCRRRRCRCKRRTN